MRCPISDGRVAIPWAATYLEDLVGSSSELPAGTSLCLRRDFTISDPEDFEGVILTLRVTESWFGFLNGKLVARRDEETGRGSAGAASPRGAMPPDRSNISLPLALLRRGKNVVAIRTVLSGESAFGLVLAAKVDGVPNAERTRDTLEKLESDFQATPPSPGHENRLRYLEARNLELSGNVEAAINRYRELVRQDSQASLPAERLAACLLKRSADAGIEREIRELLETIEHPSPRLWHRWLVLCFDKLGWTPDQVLERFPVQKRRNSDLRESLTVGTETYRDDLRWLVKGLAKGSVRVNCGGDDYLDTAGTAWSRDRFFVGGSLHYSSTKVQIDGTADDELHTLYRWFFYGEFKGYRIPIPSGRYRVTLHFAEIFFPFPGCRVFDVFVESKPVLENLDLVRDLGFARITVVPLNVDVEDGLLEIEFGHRVENPLISSIEIEANPGLKECS